MSQALGIFWSSTTVQWAVIEKERDTLQIMEHGSWDPASDENTLPAELPDDISLACTGEASYFFPVSFPFKAHNKIQAVLKSDIEERCLDPIDTVVVDFLQTEETQEGLAGIAVSAPRDRIAAMAAVGDAEHSPAMITLDSVALAAWMGTARADEDWYIICLNADNAALTHIKEGQIQAFRSIPADIKNDDDLQKVITELLKRFNPEAAPETVMLQTGEADLLPLIQKSSYTALQFPLDGDIQPEAGSSVYTAAAVAASSSKARHMLDFRQEDLVYSGLFSATANHSIILLSSLVIILLAVISGLSIMHDGYEQEIKSIEGRIKRETEEIIDAKILAKELNKPGVDISRAVKTLAAKYRGRGKSGDSELPDSAFQILNIIFELLPEALDITWERLSVTQRNISMYGRFDYNDAANVKLFDTFVRDLKGSGRFKVRNQSATGGRLRLVLEYLPE